MNNKYPRTFHLPFSPGVSSDDRIIETIDYFKDKEIVVTEKIDGECSGLTSVLCHARSLDSKNHPSRNWIKSLHGQIKHEIPSGWKIFGENVYALHSIHYHNLETYFYVFSMYNDKNFCLSWNETVEYVELLGLKTAPVLYRGVWDENKVKACWTGISTVSPGDQQEGYVVRLAESFHYDDFSRSVVKFVRDKHVSTDEHWLEKPVVPNLLRK